MMAMEMNTNDATTPTFGKAKPHGGSETTFFHPGTEAESEYQPPATCAHPTHAHYHQKQPPGTDHPAMDAAAVPAMYTGVESLTSAEEAANAGNLVRTMVPHGFFDMEHDDYKHVSQNTKKALMGLNAMVTAPKCLFCGNSCPSEKWSCCAHPDCVACERCAADPATYLFKMTRAGNARCANPNCKLPEAECSKFPARNLLAEKFVCDLKNANVGVSEAMREDGMQEAARRAGEDPEEVATAGRRGGRASGHADGKKRKSQCTPEEWEEHKAAAKARKLQREQDKAKLALFDGLQRQVKFLRDKLSDHNEDLYDEWINEFDLLEASAAAGLEVDDAETDEE